MSTSPNYSNQNLQGYSFKGQDLKGADFSGANLSGADFSGANLSGAKFINALAGLQPCWKSILAIIALLLIVLILFSFVLFNEVFEILQKPVSLFFLIVMPLVFLLFRKRTWALKLTSMGLVGLSGIVFEDSIVSLVALLAFMSFLTAILVTVLVLILIDISEVMAKVLWLALGTIVLLFIAVNPITVAVAIISTDIVWQAVAGDEKHAFIRKIAIGIAVIQGTSFRKADLTDADFTGARLKSTDLRGANLTRVRWYGAKMLDRVRPGDTYLQYTQIRQWLIGKGIDKNFDGQKLQGINLQGANLTDASFIAANLSEANLQDADLSRAKLVQTQLDGTDFTRATLTGAFIEDWGITTHTKLNEVKCKYVFMRLPTKENPNPRRKPDNEKEDFKGDDFADFIKPIFDTLDLYHNQGVDPRAIAISWKELAENNPDANLQFASMEVKGEDNLLLRLKTAPDADLSQLNAEYFETYNQLKALAETESKKLIAEKDNRIQQLENMVNTALKRPNFYAENYQHQGDTNMTGEKRDIKAETYYEQSGKLGIGHVSGGEFKDNTKIAGEINEAQKQNLADAATEIQQLLEKLSETYPTTTSKEKNIVIGEAVEQIENNPTLKAKVINALKAGGTEAFKEAVNHPLVNILVATIEGWQDAESS